MSVAFITFCHPKLLARLHAPGVLESIIASHSYDFDEILLIHQRCRGLEYNPVPSYVRIVESENYPTILSDFGVPEEDARADEISHGPTAAHYWKWHLINHLIGLKEAKTDYIVFSDCDCNIIKNDSPGWINKGISLLNDKGVFIVSPSDGGSEWQSRIGDVRLTRNVSQQLFLCNRTDFGSINFDLPWDGEYTAPGGPFQEYYVMAEGRIWRYLEVSKRWRAILPDNWRYWHHQW